MLAETIRTMYGYTAWANEKIFGAAGGVPPAEALEVAPGSERSLVETLLHMIDAHRGWLSWWDGSATTVEDRERLRYDRALFPDVASVRAAWPAVQSQTAALLSTLTEEGLEIVYERTLRDGRTFKQPLWRMMLHVANHGTQHRSEAAAMATGAGCSPGDLDLVYYLG